MGDRNSNGTILVSWNEWMDKPPTECINSLGSDDIPEVKPEVREGRRDGFAVIETVLVVEIDSKRIVLGKNS